MTRNVKRRIPTEDANLISRVFDFVNAEHFENQEQVYQIFRGHPYVQLLNLLPESDDVKPFLYDRATARRALVAIATGKNLAEVHEKLREKIGMTLSVGLTCAVDRGRISLDWQPVLTGIEACVFYGLSLLFKHDLDVLVRICKARLDDGAECGKVFFYSPKLRRFCSKAHADIGNEQRLHDWHDDRREQLGLPKFRWGEGSRKKRQRARTRRGNGTAKKS